MVGRFFDKDGETVQQCVTAGARSEPAVFQVIKSGLRRSPIALSKRYSTSSKPMSRVCILYRRFASLTRRLRIIEPFQGSVFMSSTSQNLPTTRDYKSNMTNTGGGVYRINTPRQEAFVMLNGVKHLRCVHVDVHELLRFCSG